MNKKIRKIFVYLIFIIVFIFLFNKISILLIRKGNGYGTDILNFYQQKENSIDILVLGSSHAYSAINPYQIEEKTGLKAYDFCTQQQPIWLSYFYLKEALKTQSPKYIVVELHMAVFGDYDYAKESVNRDAIDKMKFSLNKLEAIKASVDPKEEKLSYYFNIIKYHSRYKELKDEDYKTAFLGETVDNKGYVALPKKDCVFNKNTINTDEEEILYSKNLRYLKKIIALAKEKNIEIILVKTPAKYKEPEIKKLNYINRLALSENILFLNYVKNIDTINLDFNNDFHDQGHLNKEGSKKFTDCFIKDIGLINS